MCLCVFLPVSVCLSDCLSICLSVSLSVCLVVCTLSSYFIYDSLSLCCVCQLSPCALQVLSFSLTTHSLSLPGARKPGCKTKVGLLLFGCHGTFIFDEHVWYSTESKEWHACTHSKTLVNILTLTHIHRTRIRSLTLSYSSRCSLL